MDEKEKTKERIIQIQKIDTGYLLALTNYGRILVLDKDGKWSSMKTPFSNPK